jgi:DNA glycosylase AlkZ-like
VTSFGRSASSRKPFKAEGPLTRAQIAERLRRNDIAAEGQATIHLIWRAAIDGLVCYGPEHVGDETFVALDDWLPQNKRIRPADPVLELARRYLAAYGPATREDFVVWSGLARRDVSRAWSALRTESTPVSTPYGEMLFSRQHATPAPAVARLLPSFDGLWVATASTTFSSSVSTRDVCSRAAASSAR